MARWGTKPPIMNAILGGTASAAQAVLRSAIAVFFKRGDHW
jgi:hypothetical protein